MAILPGLGIKLQYETATPGTYADFAQVVEIGGFSLEYGIVETTNLDSVAATFRGTLLRPGTVPFKVQFDPDNTGHKWFVDKMLSGISLPSQNFKLKLTDSTPTTWSFSGIPKNFSIGNMTPESEYVTADFEIQISGAPTYA